MNAIADRLGLEPGQAVTTLCHCWRLTRQDDAVLGFTDHDRALTVDGTVFRPDTGLAASEAKASLGLSVDTVDVEGALSSLDIAEDDIAAGLYDGATVETLLADWTDPHRFALIRKAAVGKIERRDGRFVAELQSLTADLDQPNGRTVRRKCDAELGDARCGFDLGREGFHGSGTVTAVEGNDTLIVAGIEAFDGGWFANGLLTWTSGANEGRSERIVGHRRKEGTARLVLWSERLGAVRPGDRFTLVAGCDKRFSTCKAKFDNAVNFRGFPHLPGNDAAYGYVNEEGVFDGGAIVE